MVQYYPQLFALVLGLVVGSFGNVLIHRLPQKQSIIKPGSHCPACDQQLSWYDNIPLLSWLLLGGKCRSCGVRIAWRYPLVELATGLLFLLCSLLLPDWRHFLFYLPLLIVAIPLTLIDYDHLLLPDRLVYPLIVAGLVVNGINALLPLPQQILPVWSGLAGGGFALALFYIIAALSLRLLGKEGIGGGDIKLVAALGLFAGMSGIMVGIFLASLLGTLWQGALILGRRRQTSRYFPFGPYLILGTLVAVLWGERLIEWYIGWFI
ncbi:MAG: prepilin peptidase [Candidatus Delongbacteria bacterium]|nr:prepilin peptidase [Candidatus Delongbacteria bacterium]